MAARNVNYFVCSDGTPALPEPAGYLTTSSKATTLQELKRDLAGKSTVPRRKFDVLIATGQGTWAADGFYDQLPEGPLHVQIVPLGQPTGGRGFVQSVHVCCHVECMLGD